MNSTKSPNAFEPGDIVRYNDILLDEDVKIIRINRWRHYGTEYMSYDIRFLSDDYVRVDCDPSLLHPKKEK